jgi:hypothetical protein
MILKAGVVAAPSVQVLIPPDLPPGVNAIKLFSSSITQQTSKLESLFLGSFFQPRLILASMAETTPG